MVMCSKSSTQVIRSVGWGNVLLASLSIVFSIVFFEIALRVLPISYLKRLRDHQEVGQGVREVHPRNLYTLHPEIGWTLTPGFNGTFQKEDFSIQIDANEHGIRNENVGPKEADTLRILGLGDSFAFGWGVENEQTFLKVLEEKLNSSRGVSPWIGIAGQDARPTRSGFRNDEVVAGASRPGLALPGRMPGVRNVASARNDRRYEVVNAGMPGFGTFEALQLLRTTGMDYQPDLVILAFYEGNDYRNNGDAPRKREIRNGYLADVTNKKHPFLKFVTDHSVLAGLIESRVSSLNEKTQFSKNVEKTERYLLQMKEFLTKKNIPFVFLFIPDQDEAVYERSDWLWRYDRLLGGMDLFEARARIEYFCRLNNIAYYRLSGVFENAEISGDLRLKDTHFNERGHAQAADEIFLFLRETFGEEILSS